MQKRPQRVLRALCYWLAVGLAVRLCGGALARSSARRIRGVRGALAGDTAIAIAVDCVEVPIRRSALLARASSSEIAGHRRDPFFQGAEYQPFFSSF